MMESQRSNRGSSIWGAAVLILVGVFFLLQQFGTFSFRNWWALFILIPVAGSIGTAYGMWRRSERFSYAIWSTLWGGIIPLAVALMFLLELDWGTFWPVFVILPSVSVFTSGMFRWRTGEQEAPPALSAHRWWLIFLGLSAFFFGWVFLGINLDLLILSNPNWWGLFILGSAVGGVFATLQLITSRQSMALVLINLVLTAVVILTGMVAFLGLGWELMRLAAPIALILMGVGFLLGRSNQKE